MSISNLLGGKVALGQLTVGKEIGKGGFGVVYEAALSGVSFPFAVKFLDPSPFNTDAVTARKRFYKEAELLLKLRHPHIIAIYGLGEHEGKPYILMEKFDGFRLREVRDRSAPDPTDVLPFVEFIAGALAYAHSKNVVHRDIKPSNLMTIRGDARVLDFGIAAVLDPDGSRLTRTGGTVAGDAYSAPELIENPKLLDPRCDIYSVGACWFWLLTGKTPQGTGWEASLREVDGVSPDYQRVLLGSLASSDKRYPTMEQLLEQVRSLRAGLRPALRPDEIGDDDAYVLGVIASELSVSSEAVTPHQLEHAASSMTPLALRIAHKKLLRLKMVETSTEEDFNGNEFRLIRLLSEGETWLEKNQERVATLLRARAPKPVPHNEDIPF